MKTTLSLLTVVLGLVVSRLGSADILFLCADAQRAGLEKSVWAYLEELDFPKSEVVAREGDGGALRFSLDTPISDTDTLDLWENPKLDIHPEILSYRREDGRTVWNAFTSRKEILAALLQHGREYRMTGERCSVAALKEHIGIRQNIAKWNKVAERRWNFPEKWETDGTLSSLDTVMNPVYWDSDQALLPNTNMATALADPFTGKFQYAVYCRMATELVIAQALFDYYANVAPNPQKLALLEQAAQGDPLAGIVPAYDDAGKKISKGKYFDTVENIPPDNWIPGDWGYIRNNDPVSHARPGYEGSNFVYQGSGLISNYWSDNPGAGRATHYFYNDEEHTLNQHLAEVFQWRRGITENWQHDPRRIFVSDAEVQRLRQPPEKGGLLLDMRQVWADEIHVP